MLSSKALNKMRGSLALFMGEGSARGPQLRERCDSPCGARETVAGVREQSRGRWGWGGWGEKADRGLNFPAVSGASSDFFRLYVSEASFWLQGRGRVEGNQMRVGGQMEVIAVVQERGDGNLDKTMAVRMERSWRRHNLVIEWLRWGHR